MKSENCDFEKLMVCLSLQYVQHVVLAVSWRCTFDVLNG